MEVTGILYSIIYIVIFSVMMLSMGFFLFHFNRLLKLISTDERKVGKYAPLLLFYIPVLQTDEMKFHFYRIFQYLLIAIILGTGLYFLEEIYGKPPYMD